MTNRNLENISLFQQTEKTMQSEHFLMLQLLTKIRVQFENLFGEIVVFLI
jgi:hypothetical protein